MNAASFGDDAPVLVSACLLGVPCRYNGRSATHPAALRLLEAGRAVPVCPELLGGLPTPRAPVELNKGRAVDSNGRDVTAEFRSGALAALAQGLERGCASALLKSRSPSCGCGQVYDGQFRGVLVPGDGLFAALLKERGFQVCCEDELPDPQG